MKRKMKRLYERILGNKFFRGKEEVYKMIDLTKSKELTYYWEGAEHYIQEYLNDPYEKLDRLTFLFVISQLSKKFCKESLAIYFRERFETAISGLSFYNNL